jgi:hypothetical protein
LARRAHAARARSSDGSPYRARDSPPAVAAIASPLRGNGSKGGGGGGGDESSSGSSLSM